MLIQRFHQLIRTQDVSSARRLLTQAKEMQYPVALINSMETLIKSAELEVNNNALSRKLVSKELPVISLSNYLLFREDLRALGYDESLAESHLNEYGIQELIEEEKKYPQMRRYLDLNDATSHDFALLLIHSDCQEESESIADLANELPVFHTSLNDLTVYIHELETKVSLQAFAAWLSLRRKIPYLCILDQSDRPIEGWQSSLKAYLNSEHDIVFSEEYVVNKSEPRLAKRNRQYKSLATRFRVFTRGYVSGIFAVKSALLSQLNNTNRIYPSTWCLQVDILQQSGTSPHLIDIPLMVRNQSINCAILEYGDRHIRDHFYFAKEDYLDLCKDNLEASPIFDQHFPAQISQGREGEIVFTPKQEIQSVLVSVIIPFRDEVNLLRQCIQSLFAMEQMISYEIILADNGSAEEETRSYIQELRNKHAELVTHVYIDEPFNYSRVNNLAAIHARGTFILLLNNDIEFSGQNPLARMAAYFALEPIGAVGATLHYEDQAIQHAGIVMTPFEPYDTYSPYKGTREYEYDSFQINLRTVDEWSAATAACLLIRTEDWQRLCGLDENLTVAYNDVDFCLRLQEIGKHVVSIPGLDIKHYESKSRGNDTTGEKYNRLYKEASILRSKHISYFESADPYWPEMLSIANPRAWPRTHDLPIILHNVCENGITHRITGSQPAQHAHTCVYVGFDSRSRIRPDVIEQIRILSSVYNVTYVTSSHETIIEDPLFSALEDLTCQVLIRKNVGYDFGSWRAGILELGSEITESKTLLLMNDSLYGPIFPLDELMQRTINHESDIVCMTKNMVGGEHAQSYFVSYRQTVTQSHLFRMFWQNLPVYGCKYSLIRECEISWSQALIQAGHKITALFDSGCYGNQTHITWKDLICEQNYPFIKNELLLRNPVGQDLSGMKEILEHNSNLYTEMLRFWQETYTRPLCLKST